MITVRMCEYEYYDIEHDRQALRLQAITNRGTWWADVDANKGVARSKKEFQTYVFQSMSEGSEQHEVRIGL